MKRNKILLSLAIILLPVTMIRAQEITFSSQEFEAGVRYHLGIDASTPIQAEQLKSITAIDLSCLGLTNISDIAYMPELRKLDLHDNEISDISPLLSLESLNEVNLSYNNLSSIFPLSFSRSRNMKVNVAFNHIADFSVFTTLTFCQFTIAGAGLQTQKDKPYFMVRYLYSDGTETQPTVYCRVEATTVEQAQMTVQDVTHTFAADNESYVCQLGDGYSGTYQVKVGDGTYSDSTYIVALKIMHVDPSDEVTFSTELPENYELRFSPAQNGTLSCEGTDLTFKASASFDYEEVIYSFYCGDMIKGISKLILTKEDLEDGTVTNRDYKLTYMVDGEEYKTINYDYGSTITAESIPIMEGYTFSGWSEIPSTMPAHDVTVTGSFSINSYTLTYMVDGTEYKTASLEYGSAITAETAPTMEGYTFSGWSDIPETMPAYDIVIIGSFTKNYELGDATGDGVVDISDYIGVANYILGIPQTGFNADAADVNKDGVIDISDYIGVANIILTGKP